MKAQEYREKNVAVKESTRHKRVHMVELAAEDKDAKAQEYREKNVAVKESTRHKRVHMV